MSHARSNILTPKNEMRTPPSLFNKLNSRFHFNLDAAATDDNNLCDEYYTIEENALKQKWLNPTYCNPPYSPKGTLDQWVEKGYKESLNGNRIIMLLPVDFSTNWWNYCMYASEWIRVKGRIHFNGIDNKPIKGSPLFDSCIIVFNKEFSDGFILSEINWKD